MGLTLTLQAQVMAAMGMTLRVVVPPHPLIAHWLTLLRDRTTPHPLYATAMAELGRWLTYEAVRDWLPQRSVEMESPTAPFQGTLVDPGIPLLAIPVLPAGLGLWQGGQHVLPNARVAHVALDSCRVGDPPRWVLDGLPRCIGERVGSLLYLPQIATGGTALALLERLQALGVDGLRLRLVTALTAAPGLASIAERFPELTIYTGCIDAELNERRLPLPGIGDPTERLYGTVDNGSLG